MKNILFILLFFSLAGCISDSEKGIENYFLDMPKEYFGSLSIEDKQILLEKGRLYPSSNTDEEIVVYTLASPDKVKEFIRMEMFYESGQASFSTYELRMFKKTTGGNIIVYSVVSGAHNMYWNSRFLVFEDNNDSLTISNQEYFPINIGLDDFIMSNTPDSIKNKYENNSSYCYALGNFYPNITYQLHDNELNIFNINTDYIIGNIIQFDWNGEKFIRHEVEFDK